jgi:hypothetical protein
MKKFEVTFRYFSHYKDDSEDMQETVINTYEAVSEEALDEELEEDMDWSDECVYNYDAKSDTIETGREWMSTKEIK